MDFFEEYYLLFDSVDTLLGSPFAKKKMLVPLLIRSKFVAHADQWSCIFSDYVDKIPNRKVLLDHIFVSAKLEKFVTHASIGHDIIAKYAAQLECRTDAELYMRQCRLSDHRPVFMDFL